jgi:circadian clock protein KaiB
MKGPQAETDTSAFEEAVKSDQATCVLRLYVAGTTPRSTQAIASIKCICEEHLQGRYELEVIDVYRQPVLAKGEQIIAAPTLIKKLPLPPRRLIGDMSNVERILVGLDMPPLIPLQIYKTALLPSKSWHNAAIS